MIKLSLSTPVPPEEQAAVDAWLDAAARLIEASMAEAGLEQRWLNFYVHGCSHPEMLLDSQPAWPPTLPPP